MTAAWPTTARPPLPIAYLTLVLLCTALIAACGGGTTVAGVEGTGGSQQGDVSGFSSIIVNGATIATDRAEIIINGQTASESELNVGDMVSISTRPDGSASRIVANRTLGGPLESVDFANGTAIALSQSIRITASTRLDNTTFTEQDDSSRGRLSPANNDLIAVTGYYDADGALVATRLQRAAQSYDRSRSEFDLIGPVSGLNSDARSFAINALEVDYRNAAVQGQLRNGANVKIVGQQTVDGGLFTARQVTVLPVANRQAGQAAGLAGFVTELGSEQRFIVADTTVDASTAERLDNSSEQLSRNSFVRVSGEISPSGELIAQQFSVTPESDVSIVGAANIVDNTLTVFNTTVIVNPFTIYQDLTAADNRTFGRANINQADHLKVIGYYDRNNQLTANVIEKRPPGSDDAVRGAVEICDPFTNQLTIAAIEIHTDSSTRFRDREGREFSGLTEFCSQAIGGSATATGEQSHDILIGNDVTISR